MSFDDRVITVLDALKLRDVASRSLADAPEWLTRRKARRIRHRSRLVEPEVLQRRFAEAIALLRSLGSPVEDYLEFGVYNGSSLTCMYRALEQSGIHDTRLIGFDSFEGLPPVAATDSGGHWPPGAFSSSLEFTQQCLDHEGVDRKRVTLIKGFYETSLTPERREALQIRRASVIMIDCDLYQSTKEALEFCSPVVGDRVVIFFDDWYPLADKGLGERKAFEEWLEARPDLGASELFDFPFYGKTFLVTRTPVAA